MGNPVRSFYIRNIILSIKIKQKGKPIKNETTSKTPLYLAFNIEDLEKCSEENIKSIEKHLDSNSYLIGYEPSTLDTKAYKSLKTRNFSNWQDFPNLQRWFCHIESFSSDEQNAFMVQKYGTLKFLFFFLRVDVRVQWILFRIFIFLIVS